jgi:hypothetical protein
MLRARVVAHNAEASANMNTYGGDGHFERRPIPQSQIDLVTEGPKYPQNPGY